MLWYFVAGGQTRGPVEPEKLLEFERQGLLQDGTMVWAEGMADWVALASVRDQLGAPPAPPKAPVRASADAAAAPAPEAAAPEAAAPPAGTHRCDECGQYFQPDELLQLKGKSICPNCKPAFLQRLKDGERGPLDLPLAGFWRRFGARFIDIILYQIVNFGFNAAIKALLGTDARDPKAVMAAGFIAMPVVLLTTGAYESVMTARWGATVGKMALGLKVVDEEGQLLTLKRSVLRYLATLLSGFTCCIGYLIMLGHPKHQTMHDRLVGTLVVRT